MTFYPFQFDAPISWYDVGSEHYAYTVVWLPADVAERLPLDQHPRLRIIGEANEVEFRSALMPVRGVWYILFSAKALKAMDASVGDQVSIAFAIDDQEAVEIPSALQMALSENDELAKLWAKQTAGQQRGHAFRVGSAKSSETQAKRVAEIWDIMAGRRDRRGRLL